MFWSASALFCRVNTLTTPACRRLYGRTPKITWSWSEVKTLLSSVNELVVIYHCRLLRCTFHSTYSIVYVLDTVCASRTFSQCHSDWKRRVQWGLRDMGRGVPIPSWLGGLGSVLSSPGRVRGRTPAGNAFCVFWRPHNAPFCTYMPMLWVRQTVVHVTFGSKAEVWGQ